MITKVSLLLLVTLAFALPQDAIAAAGPEIRLDDISMPVSISGLNATAEARNIVCSGLDVSDLNVQWDLPASDLLLSLAVHDFALDCQLDYAYSAPPIIPGNNGTVVIGLRQNTLLVDLAVQDLGDLQTETTTVNNCAITINVDTIDFLNVEPLASVFEQFANDVTADLATSFCELLSDPQELNELLSGGGSNNALTSIMASLARADPLAPELQLEPLVVATAVDLTHASSWPAWGVAGLINWVGDSFGKKVPRSYQDAGSGEEEDLMINWLMQDFESALTLSLVDRPILFQGGDFAAGAGSLLSLDRIQILGLDSFQELTNFQLLGKHTMQVDLAIEEVVLRVSGDLTTTTGSSAARVEVDFPVRDLSLTIAVLLAVDEAVLGALPFKAFLGDTANALACILSSVSSLQVADTTLHSLRVLVEPSDSLQSINDAGISFGLVTVITDILPRVLNFTSTCEISDQIANEANPYIDFRDLLLEPSQAIAYGGVGSQPYGTVLSSVKTYLNKELLATDENGDLLVNANLIVPFTEGQSGTAGTLDYEGPFVNFTNIYEGRDVVSRVSLSIKDFRLEGLDSFEDPTELFEPVEDDPFSLDNMLAMKSFRMTGVVIPELYMSFLGEKNTPVNDIAFEVDLDSAAILIDLFSVIYEDQFLAFPLEDIFDINCWLSAIAAPVSGLDEKTLTLRNLEATFAGIKLSASCPECTPVFEPLSVMFESVNREIKDFLSPFLGDESVLQKEIDRMLVDAPKKCRHHPDYDPATSATQRTTGSVELESRFRRVQRDVLLLPLLRRTWSLCRGRKSRRNYDSCCCSCRCFPFFMCV